MDPDKWKSVAVPIKTWDMLKKMSEGNDRSIGGEITNLAKREYVFFSANLKNSPDHEEAFMGLYKEKVDKDKPEV
jgi:hypothetical protein|tara:strand:+ start:258 stop:482 length:225 start_codon:yes stop_codon:yes gene_type:complete